MPQARVAKFCFNTRMNPIELMISRVESEAEVSTSAYCDSLLNGVEMITKHVAALLVALIAEDSASESARYRFEFELFRSSGIGDWANAVRLISVGSLHRQVAKASGDAGAPDAISQLTEKTREGDWRYEVGEAIHRCVREVGEPIQPLKTLSLIDAFTILPVLRNKMDAHGAPTSATKARVATLLAPALELLWSRLDLLELPLVAVRSQPPDGRPSVRSVAPSAGDHERGVARNALVAAKFSDGIYVVLDAAVRRVSLIQCDAELRDYFYANGHLKTTDKTADMLSYVTGNRLRQDVENWTAPPGRIAESSTSALGSFEARGRCFTNAPSPTSNYVERPGVQDELRVALRDNRRFIVTLQGSGGVGKTSLALRLVEEACQSEWFDLVIWFSARDVDLRETSPVVIRPDVTTLGDVTTIAGGLLEDFGIDRPRNDEAVWFADRLADTRLGRVLWVFDNFETLHAPREFFKFLDQAIRDPHKVLITTRHREFKGDLPIDVPGMEFAEFELLVAAERARFHMGETDVDVKDLFIASSGHPYVAKVLLSSLRTGNPTKKAELALRRSDGALDFLFERSFDRLAEDRQFVFLLLCSWRSTVPQVALEIAVNGYLELGIDIESALQDLDDNSLVDLVYDNVETWVNTQMAAWVFGNKKLSSDARRNDVRLASEILQLFGTTTLATENPSVAKIASNFWAKAREHVGGPEWATWKPCIEKLARLDTELWLQLGARYEEVKDFPEAIRAYRRLIEDTSGDPRGWKSLAKLYEFVEDSPAALDAWVQRAVHRDSPIEDVTFAANKVNGWFASSRVVLDPQQRRLLVEPLIAVMERREKELDAIAMSRLGWLYANIKDPENAISAARRGLERDPTSENCLGILKNVKI